MQKEDLDAFTLDVRLLGDIMHMTPKQTLDKFKDLFDSEISAHLLEANDIEAAKAKAQQLIYLYRNKYMPNTASTVLLHEQIQPRTILEHQLAETEDHTQVLNLHTVDDKYCDSNKMIHSDTKTSKYSDRDSQNDKYNQKTSKWRGNTNHGRFSYRSRGNCPHGQDAGVPLRKDQSYGYQYSQLPRGIYPKQFP